MLDAVLTLFLAQATKPQVSPFPQPKMGILRGPLVSREGSVIRLQAGAEGQPPAECRFDLKTWMERDGQRIEPAALAPGDRLEIVADRGPSDSCYIRTLHVLDVPPPPQGPGRRPSMKREYASPTERFAPRGDLTYTGLIVEFNDKTLAIRTRADGVKHFLLRHDTRYVGDGMRTSHDDLKQGARVFVRAGHNFEGDIEAYQVIWGEILKP